MKLKFTYQWMAVITAVCLTSAQVNAQYTNSIRQFQMGTPGPDDDVESDISVAPVDQRPSPLLIDDVGARFELWTIDGSTTPPTSTLIDTRYVGVYVPLAEVTIRTEDTNSAVPRTRADRPFYVDIKVAELREGADDPEASKSVQFYHHTQSYGVGGTGLNLDTDLATLASQVKIKENTVPGAQPLTYPLTSIAGDDRSKIRGEERFSIFALDDFQKATHQLASKTVQIWPVADGTISGIENGATIEFSTPPLTLAINDIYPEARIYAQVYQGEKRDDGFVGEVIPGSAEAINEPVPQTRLLTIPDWDSVITANGTWTMELLTVTPFGIDRLDWVSFTVDRTISVRAASTTSE
jgi:hypothetical protein